MNSSAASLSPNIPAVLDAEYQNSWQHKLVWKGLITRYRNLSEPARGLADEGISRYLAACRRLEILVDASPIREIIEDASTGRQIWKETDTVFIENLGTESSEDFRARLNIKSTT